MTIRGPKIITKAKMAKTDTKTRKRSKKITKGTKITLKCPVKVTYGEVEYASKKTFTAIFRVHGYLDEVDYDETMNSFRNGGVVHETKKWKKELVELDKKIRKELRREEKEENEIQKKAGRR